MKFLGLISIIILFHTSCETDHSYKRVLVNHSSHDLYIQYNNHYLGGDSSYFMSINDSMVLSEWWKLGAYQFPDSCVIFDTDTIWVQANTSLPIVFIGDFRDESSWETTFVMDRSSKQVCAFVFEDDNFAVK